METLPPADAGEAADVVFNDTEMDPEYGHDPIRYASEAGPSSTLWTAMGHEQEQEMHAEAPVEAAAEHLSVGALGDEMEYDEVPQSGAYGDAEIMEGEDASAALNPGTQDQSVVTGTEIVQAEPSQTTDQEAQAAIVEGITADATTDSNEAQTIAETFRDQDGDSVALPEEISYEEVNVPAEGPQEADPDSAPVPAEPSAEVSSDSSATAAIAQAEPVTDAASALKDFEKAGAGDVPASGIPLIPAESSLEADIASEEASPSEQQDEMPIEPVQLTFHDQAFVLFSENGESSTYTGWDDQVGAIQDVSAPRLAIEDDFFWEPLEALFRALRVKEALGEFLDADAVAQSELVLYFPDLELRLREDNIYTREIACSDLLRLHQGLGLKHSLRIEVSEDVRFISQYNLLAQQIAENDSSADGPPTGASEQDTGEAEAEAASVSEATAEAAATEIGISVADANASRPEASHETPRNAEPVETQGAVQEYQDDPSEEADAIAQAEPTQSGSVKVEEGEEEIVEYDESSSVSVNGELEAIGEDSPGEYEAEETDGAGADTDDAQAREAAEELSEQQQIEEASHGSVENGDNEQEGDDGGDDHDSEETVRATEQDQKSDEVQQAKPESAEADIGDNAELSATEDAYAAYEEGVEEDEAEEDGDDVDEDEGAEDDALVNASQISSSKRPYEDAEVYDEEEEAIDAKKSKTS